MIFVSYIHVLAAALLMGLAAAAPMGPVNMMAVRRGVAAGWRHTLACGIGAVFGDLVLFSLALLGGRFLLPGLYDAKLRIILAAIGAAVLVPVGIYFFTLAFKDHRKAFKSARRRWSEGPIPARLAAEAAQSAAMTIFNPLTMLYWVAVTSNWLPTADSVLGYRAPAWGILMAGAGMMAWFTALIVFVRFIPNHIGATFFRLANAILGLILLGFGMYCAATLSRYLFR
jgi:threonine/homoserine/homoserine lactone efflux protein